MAYNIIGNGYNYLGVTAATPPNLQINPNAPTINNMNANIGDFWLQQNTTNLWFLTSLADQQAIWTQITATAGDVLAVDGGDNINVTTVAGIATVNLNKSISQPNTTADGSQGMYSLGGQPFMHNYGINNTFLGYQAGGNFESRAFNIVGLGDQSALSLASGQDSVFIGKQCAIDMTATNQNSFLGAYAGNKIRTGTNNLLLGYASGFSYTSDESDNVILATDAVAGDQLTIRIGDPAIQTSAYMAGIYDSAVDGGTQQFVIVDSTGKLGSSVGGGGGGGLDTLSADTGGDIPPTGGNIDIAGGLNINTAGAGSTITVNLNKSILLPDTTADGLQGLYSLGGSSFMHNYGTSNTFLGKDAGNLTNTSISCVAIGDSSGASLISSSFCTLVGAESGRNLDVQEGNTFVGYQTGQSLTDPDSEFNVVMGSESLRTATLSRQTVAIGQGSFSMATESTGNTGVGASVGSFLLTGSYNCLLGLGAGFALESDESSNILISSAGQAGDQNTIRIGSQGTGTGQQNKAYIAGITGVTVANSATVLIDTVTGQLGTIVSARRYKKEIFPIGKSSRNILDLEPVQFKYIDDKSDELHYGLIADDVMNIYPGLVVFNESHEPETIKYQELPALLLNELKRAMKRIDRLEHLIEDMRK